MYEHLATSSIPSDIHLISCASQPSFMHHHQLYGQLFADDLELGLQHHHRQQQRQQQLKRQPLRPALSLASSSPSRAGAELMLTFQRQRQLKQLAREQQQVAAAAAAAARLQLEQQCTARLCQQLEPRAALFDCGQQQPQQCLTLEELKTTRNSCWLCGCNWREDHVSLDCPECDGYALTRPCPSCDGKCKQVWQRNISATHDKHRALWTGRCALEPQQQQQQQRDQLLANSSAGLELPSGARADAHLLAPAPSSVCSSRPSSAVSSDDEPDDFLSL